MRKFSYVDADVVPEVQETIDKSLTGSVGAFVRWWLARLTAPYPSTLSRRKAFDVWWRMRGPINFTSFEDSRRYKAELWERIEEEMNAAHGGDSKNV